MFSTKSTDKPIDNLDKDALEWEIKENFNKPPSQASDKHLQALLKPVELWHFHQCLEKTRW